MADEISCCPLCHGKELVQEWNTPIFAGHHTAPLRFKVGRCHCGNCGIMIARDVMEILSGKMKQNKSSEGNDG